MGNIERAIIALDKKRENTDKETIVVNLKRLINERFPGEDYSKVVARLTDTPSMNTVYSWFNLSRENVKIPFLKLCKLLAELDASMEELFTNQSYSLEYDCVDSVSLLQEGTIHEGNTRHIGKSQYVCEIPKGHLRCPFCGRYSEAISENWCLIQPIGDKQKYLACRECEGIDGEYKY